MISMLRGATWVYAGSLLAVGSVALASLCYRLLTLAADAATALLDQFAREF